MNKKLSPKNSLIKKLETRKKNLQKKFKVLKINFLFARAALVEEATLVDIQLKALSKK